MAVFSLHTFLLQNHTKVNTSRRFLVGCSDRRFLVYYSLVHWHSKTTKARFVLSALHDHDSCFKHQDVSLSQQIIPCAPNSLSNRLPNDRYFR